MNDKGHNKDSRSLVRTSESRGVDALVLDKGIFSNVFEKDIRRIYIYKKSERIAKAVCLISPALKDTKILRERIERISIGLIDASVLPPTQAREHLSRELLSLGSVLSMARAAGHLSPMNADIIANEAHLLLQEIASYEEPKVSFEEAPSLAALSKTVPKETYRENRSAPPVSKVSQPVSDTPIKGQESFKGHISDKTENKGRREVILSILRSKGPSYIKDLSTLIRDVSEKTIQRELQALVSEGVVRKSGERRWTTYTLNSTSASAGAIPSPY